VAVVRTDREPDGPTIRQVARRLKDGRLEVVTVPEPSASPGTVAVRLSASVISAGTERATLEVARKSLVGKARARPDQARQAVDRMRRDGVKATLGVVRQRLDELGPLGYSACGSVVEADPWARGIKPGDTVAIAGAGHANHAEVDVVPSLLCARVPDGVAPSEAAFATLGAISMHGFRRAEAAVGATVAVIGLGVIGQLATRVALAAGCRVVATDLDPWLVDLAARAGAHGIARAELDFAGVADSADAVLICAAADTNDPIETAARLARDRGTVVMVGAARMDVPRGPYYDKELDLRLSRSYGPGRYDRDYERWGLDYPVGYVRWTQQRNMEAFLQLVADGKLSVAELITHRFPFERAEDAFAALDGDDPLVGVVLEYADAPKPVVQRVRTAAAARTAKPRFALIGAGNFATATIVPRLVAAGLEPAAVVSASGLSAESARSRLGFDRAFASPEEAIEASDVDLVVIATRHDTHADLTARALAAGKATYVEKPLAFDAAGMERVREALAASDAPLWVGFNRRWSPHTEAITSRVGGPRLMAFRVNAGPLPAGHWLNDPREGGGRLIGEGCHFVDYLCFVAGSDPLTVTAQGFGSRADAPLAATDNFAVQIAFADDSVGHLTYAANAPTGPGKERFEVSGPGAYAVIEDFKRTVVWRGTGRRTIGGRRQDKGFDAQMENIAEVIAGRAEPPSPDGYLVSTLATLAAQRALLSGTTQSVVDPSR
jgi:predicted dehydrogenase/NADPH:quinone reductase-like Zn-dependent oxidoreductase